MINFYMPGMKHYSNEYHTNDRSRFITVSVTSKNCALDCAHCNKKLLQEMQDCSSPELLLNAARALKERGGEGMLISGGADEYGAVPFWPFLLTIRQIKDMGLKVLCHTGFASREMLLGLKEAGVDKVLLDVIGNVQTIRDVYGIDMKPEDIWSCLETCHEIGLKMAPHIVLGIRFGRIDGEYRALEALSKYKPDSIAIVVIKPMRGTTMENIETPPVEDCIRFMETARETNMHAELSLGCIRPSGEYAIKLEKAAIDLGFDSIAFPSPDSIKDASLNGHKYTFHDVCCMMGNLNQL